MPAPHLYSEPELILPALYVIGSCPGATTSTLIAALEEILQPTGRDAQIIDGRRDTYFSQKVRNLVSHRNSNGMARWTYFTGGVYSLTPDGEALLELNREGLDTLFSQRADPVQQAWTGRRILAAPHRRTLVYDENVPISEGQRLSTATVARKRSAQLRAAALRHYTGPDGSIRCAVCGFDFRAVYGQLGEGYIQFHHEIPLSQYEDEGLEAYIPQALEHIKPLCANCHVMVHRLPGAPLPLEQLRELLQP